MCVVSLARTAVTDEDLSLFHDFPYVHILDLSHTGIRDAGLAHLAGLMALEGLELSHTSIGDAGLAHLARLETLKGLTVIDTKISDAALDAFRRARPSVPSPRSLHQREQLTHSLASRGAKGAPSHETAGGIGARDSEPRLHLNETMVTGPSRNEAQRVNHQLARTCRAAGRYRSVESLN